MEENRTSEDNYSRAVGGPMPGTGEPMTRPTWSGDSPGGSNTTTPTVRSNKARQIQIGQVDHGYIVNVGCQTLVFEKVETLIEKLTAYLKDPSIIEKQWMTEGIL